MKKRLNLVLFVVGLLFIQSRLSAQTDEANTLFGNGNSASKEDFGFLLAPSYAHTRMDGDVASLFHLRAGINWKDQLSFGGYFTTSLNQIRPQSETFPNVYMDYWTVGGFAEYTLFSKKAFHLTLPLYAGYGEVEMDNENGSVGLGEGNFFQIEPSALLEINLHKYVRFHMGAGYRFISEMNYRNFNQTAISGVTGYVGLKFGIFR